MSAVPNWMKLTLLVYGISSFILIAGSATKDTSKNLVKASPDNRTVGADKSPNKPDNHSIATGKSNTNQPDNRPVVSDKSHSNKAGNHSQATGKPASSNLANQTVATGNSTTAKKKSPDGGSSCRKLILILAKRMMKVLTNCTKAVKAQYPGEEFSDHFQCAIKCFMQKVEMSDQHFRISNETFNVFAVKHIPDRFHPLLYEVLQPCLTTWGPRVDPADKKCIAYGEIIKCLQDQASSHC